MSPPTTATRCASSGCSPRAPGWSTAATATSLVVPGADRLSWLHSLTSQHLERLADATGTEALVLSPAGHVEHHLVLADLGGTTWADVEPGTGAALLDVPRPDALPAARRAGAGHRPVGGARRSSARGRRRPRRGRAAGPGRPVRGARRSTVASSAGCPGIGDGGATVFDLVVARPRCARSSRPAPGRPARRSRGSTPTRRCGSRPGGRGSAWTPTTARSPTSCRWLATAVHLDKGCYRGQETVARVHNLGPAAAPAGAAAPGRRQRGAAPSPARRCSPAPARSAGSARWCATTSSASIALALVKQSVGADARAHRRRLGGLDRCRRPRRGRRRTTAGPGAGARRPVCDDRRGDSRHPDHRRPDRGGVREGRRAGAAGHRRGGRATARDCEAVGAAVIHLHIRDTETGPTLDLGGCARSSRPSARTPTWSCSCPPAGRSPTRSTPASPSSTPSRTRRR